MRLRVTPKAGRNRVEGIARDAEGNPMLKVAVTAPPEGGKANAAMVKLLAREWKLAKSALEVTTGAQGRNKTVTIQGDAETLTSRLEQWWEGWKGKKT